LGNIISKFQGNELKEIVEEPLQPLSKELPLSNSGQQQQQQLEEDADEEFSAEDRFIADYGCNLLCNELQEAESGVETCAVRSFSFTLPSLTYYVPPKEAALPHLRYRLDGLKGLFMHNLQLVLTPFIFAELLHEMLRGGPQRLLRLQLEHDYRLRVRQGRLAGGRGQRGRRQHDDAVRLDFVHDNHADAGNDNHHHAGAALDEDHGHGQHCQYHTGGLHMLRRVHDESQAGVLHDQNDDEERRRNEPAGRRRPVKRSKTPSDTSFGLTLHTPSRTHSRHYTFTRMPSQSQYATHIPTVESENKD